MQTQNVSVRHITKVTILKVRPSTTYIIEVAAVNSAGTGVYSDGLSVLTSGELFVQHTSNIIVVRKGGVQRDRGGAKGLGGGGGAKGWWDGGREKGEECMVWHCHSRETKKFCFSCTL